VIPMIPGGDITVGVVSGVLIRNHTTCPAFPFKSLVWLSVH